MSTATIAGTTPTKRVDGTDLALTDVASIDIFDDIGDGNGPQKVGSVTNPGPTFAFTTPGVLQAGITHTFTAITTDTKGHPAAASNAAQLAVPATLAPPAAITDLTATLNPDTSTAAPAAAPAASGN